MYRLLFIFLFLSYSCQQERTYPIYQPEPEVNPWEYINRISDTLQEIEGFSLFNPSKKNLSLLKKMPNGSLFIKYRIAHKRYLPVHIFLPNTNNGCYDINLYFDITIKPNGDFTAFENSGNLSSFPIDSLFHKFLQWRFRFGEPTMHWPIIGIDPKSKFDQNLFIKLMDQLANGYFTFLNEISTKKYNKPFLALKKFEQTKIFMGVPFILDYDYNRLHLLSDPTTQLIPEEN